MIPASNVQRRPSASLMVASRDAGLTGQSVLAIWDTYADLGDAAYRNGHEDVALMMLKAALKEANHPAEEGIELFEALYQLGKVYVQQRRHKKGELLLRRALETAERKIGKTDLRLCPILDSLGEVSTQENRLEKSERFYKRSLAIARRHYGRSDKKTVRGLLNLMSMYRFFNRISEAALYREKAKELDAACLLAVESDMNH